MCVCGVRVVWKAIAVETCISIDEIEAFTILRMDDNKRYPVYAWASGTLRLRANLKIDNMNDSIP